jgi:hypothetical protein
MGLHEEMGENGYVCGEFTYEFYLESKNYFLKVSMGRGI